MAIVRWKTNSNSYAIYRVVPFIMTLSDPQPTFQGWFDVEYLRNGTR